MKKYQYKNQTGGKLTNSMKSLFTILTIFLTSAIRSQDSVRARVTYSETKGDTTYHQIKIKGQPLINAKCCCKPKKKGDIIMIPKKDLLFYEDKIKFKDL